MDSKFNNENDHEMVLMLWQHCMPQLLHEYIKKPDNFEKLCSGNQSFIDANLIIKGFISISKFYGKLNFFLKILKTHINTFIWCCFQNIMLIMTNLVFKIKFNLQCIIKIGKKANHWLLSWLTLQLTLLNWEKSNKF